MNVSPRGQALIEAAKAASPTDADRARVRHALALRLGAPGVASPAGARGLPSLLGGKVPFLAALALGLGLGASAGVTWQQSREAPLSARALALPPVLLTIAVPEEAPNAPATTAPLPAASVPAASPPGPATPTARRAPSAPVSAAHAPLRDELTLLESAYRALAEGQSGEALARVGELESKHPDGALVEERLAVRALALCAEGRVAEARATRDALAARAPGSIQLGRLATSCAGEPAP